MYVTIPDTKWHHVAFVHNRATEPDEWLAYLDGNEFRRSSCDFDIGMPTATSTFALGAASYDGTTCSNAVNGVLDEVAIYDWALPLVRLKAHYYATNPCYSTASIASPNVPQVVWRECYAPPDSTLIVDDIGKLGAFRGPIIKSLDSNVMSYDYDGVQCPQPVSELVNPVMAAQTLNFKQPVFRCTGGGKLYNDFHLPAGFSGGPIRFGMTFNTAAPLPSGKARVNISCQCTGAGESFTQFDTFAHGYAEVALNTQYRDLFGITTPIECGNHCEPEDTLRWLVDVLETTPDVRIMNTWQEYRWNPSGDVN
jgi:Concanavalin A-like lectin/glucanases superfamily